MGNNTVSEITPGGAVTTLASGLDYPFVLAFGPDGNLYVANTDNSTISKVIFPPLPPTCSVTLSPNPVAYQSSGEPVTLAWSSQNATQVYETTLRWLNPSGSTGVGATQSADYSCSGYSAAYGNGATTTAILTVTPPAAPTATISASKTTVYAGQPPITITANFSAASNDTLTADNIDFPVGTGLGATTNPDATKTITFTPTTPGTYTFYARATTGYYVSWATYASVTVTVAAPPCASTASTTWSCTGPGNQTIASTTTDIYCNVTTTNLATCTSPGYCLAGDSTCYYTSPDRFPHRQPVWATSRSSPRSLPKDDPLQSTGISTRATAENCTSTGTNNDGMHKDRLAASPGRLEHPRRSGDLQPDRAADHLHPLLPAGRRRHALHRTRER